MGKTLNYVVPAATGLAMLASPAMAYVGPGLGLGAIGVVAGLLLSVILAVVALVWYPVKRMLKTKKAPNDGTPAE